MPFTFRTLISGKISRAQHLSYTGKQLRWSKSVRSCVAICVVSAFLGTLVCRKSPAIRNFSTEQGATVAFVCASSAVLCLIIASCSNFSHSTAVLSQVRHAGCAVHAHHVCKQPNLSHLVCKAGAQRNAFTRCVFTNCTAHVVYTVSVKFANRITDSVQCQCTNR